MNVTDHAWYPITQELLSKADIQINGKRPWDMKVINPDVFKRFILEGSLGLGESYMDGWWECERLDRFFYQILKNNIEDHLPRSIRDIIKILVARLFNFQTKSRARTVCDMHYDLGNQLFVRMLDPYMQYSCGYWKSASTLEEAQESKMRLICEKLQLESGMRVLDIGCGFGGLAKYMAQNYDVIVTGITLSTEQVKMAKKICEGLNVTILLQDYRDLDGEFDRIVSVEMIEHVGPKNYATYFSVVDRCLRPDGLFLLEAIGSKKSVEKHDDWIEKYIFPNGCFPSLKQIAAASEPFFVVEDCHNFGADHYATLMAWYSRFVGAWPHISHDYDERFRRMFTYYLNCSAGAFRARTYQVWQMVFSRGRDGGICVPR